MPKLKARQRDRTDEELVRLIWGKKEEQSVTSEKLCAYAHCSNPKLQRIKAAPSKYLPEVLRMGRCMGVPIEQIRAAIHYSW